MARNEENVSFPTFYIAEGTEEVEFGEPSDFLMVDDKKEEESMEEKLTNQKNTKPAENTTNEKRVEINENAANQKAEKSNEEALLDLKM